MKKILSLLFAFALLLTLFVPVVAAETDEWAETSDWSGSGGETAAQQTSDADDYSPEHGSLLFDYASLLTESEREEVLQVLSSEGKKVGCDFAVLTESYIDEDTIRSYAQEWYDSQGYGDDGALLVISMEDRNAQIVATGACEKVMNEEAGIDYLFDITVHNFIKLVKGKADTMVCNAALREVVGSDLLRTVSRTNLTLTKLSLCIVCFLLLDVV